MENKTFQNVLTRRYSRRAVLQTAALTGLLSACSARASMPAALLEMAPPETPSSLTFRQVARGHTASHALAEGYRAHLIARWGDALLPGGGPFDPVRLMPEAQQKRFGYNNDYLAYLPVPYGSGGSYHGLLHVNHEYTNAHLMFAGLTAKTSSQEMSEAQMRIEQEAQGFSLLEVRRYADPWQQVIGSPYTRRVTATTPLRIGGAAAGHARLQTSADRTGRKVRGTFANCSGGVTPWGTVLVAEENFDGYFSGDVSGAEAENHRRYGVAEKPYYGWHRFDPRFDVGREPNEPNRFGWVVEYDPYDPASTPVKRTALGRFKHETATCALTADGRLAVYSGDDDYNEYIYRFVSRDKVDLQNRAANENLLDHGVLSVARFDADGSLQWLPLVQGRGDLTAANGFHSQADVLIEARRAGDGVGATKMDRPEGIAVHPHNGEVYVALTKNPGRERTDAANPRAANRAGHIVKLMPPEGDHGAENFRWDIFVLAGDPDRDAVRYGGRVSPKGWFANPDNLAFDADGRLWIATDGMAEAYGLADGLYATEVSGAAAGRPKAFFRGPRGAEICSPCFTPDGETVFVAVQHPGEEKDSGFDNPSTRWPDFQPGMPPRPSVLAITKEGGGRIGS